MKDNISVQEHQNAIDALRKEADEMIASGYEQAYQALREAQNELAAERHRSDVYQAIARLESLVASPSCSHLGGVLRNTISELYACVGSPRAKSCGPGDAPAYNAPSGFSPLSMTGKMLKRKPSMSPLRGSDAMAAYAAYSDSPSKDCDYDCDCDCEDVKSLDMCEIQEDSLGEKENG